jgi:hypothetical protein
MSEALGGIHHLAEMRDKTLAHRRRSAGRKPKTGSGRRIAAEIKAFGT